jgi:hypothetical protein
MMNLLTRIAIKKDFAVKPERGLRALEGLPPWTASRGSVMLP